MGCMKKYAPYSYELTDEPDWGYKLHVAKTSMGWLPLFQAHENGIRSIREYKEFYDTGEVNIYDEYGNNANYNFSFNYHYWNSAIINKAPIRITLNDFKTIISLSIHITFSIFIGKNL